MSRKHWTDDDDVVLLRQVKIAQLFTVQKGSSVEAWDAVAATINANAGFSQDVDGLTAQYRFIALRNRPKRASSSASSKTKHRLLQDLLSLMHDHAQTITAQSNEEKRETTEPICTQANEAHSKRGKCAAPIEAEEAPSKRTKRVSTTDEKERKWSLKERELELRRLELKERRNEREAAQRERERDREMQVDIADAMHRRMLEVAGMLVVALMASRNRR